MRKILIVTLADDLHAYIIRDILKKRHNVSASFIEVDRMMSNLAVQWHSARQSVSTEHLVFCSPDDTPFDIHAIDLIWWRRSRADQDQAKAYTDQATADLINQDWRGALRGALLSRYMGSWVSHPEATDRAGFKLLQLDTALQCGFRIPQTLVSNDPEAVRRFADQFPDGIVVKAVAGTRHTLLVTSRVLSSELPDDETIRISPTIYQEYIPGTRHLRINQFGRDSYAFQIESQKLDWRPQLQNTIKPTDLDPSIQRSCQMLLSLLHLRMGVIDLKIDINGQPVFFEINPQGQFMFLQGITGYPIGDRFAEFLFQEMPQSSAVSL